LLLRNILTNFVSSFYRDTRKRLSQSLPFDIEDTSVRRCEKMQNDIEGTTVRRHETW